MSKFFKDLEIMENGSYFTFTLEKLPLAVPFANAIRRTMGLDIKTYSISPQSIISKSVSVWDSEQIRDQICKIPFKHNVLKNADLNMLILKLEIMNNEEQSRYVKSGDFKIINEETEKELEIKNILLNSDIPLFLINPGEKIDVTCKLEYASKREMNNARHQSGNASYYFKNEDKIISDDVEKIHFLVDNQTGYSPIEFISLSIQNIADRLKTIKEGLEKKDNSVFLSQMNKYYRFDFIFYKEDHTIGNLLTCWISHYDKHVLIGYRQPRQSDFITIDFGVERLVPKDEKELLEISEEKRKTDTIKILINYIARIEKKILELLKDSEKLKGKTIPIKDFVKKRRERRKIHLQE